MTPRRVAVTGIGAICALGTNTASVWRAASSGQPAIRPLRPFRQGALRITQAAEVPGGEWMGQFAGYGAAAPDRFAQFALLAAREAVSDSGIEFTPELCARTAIITGTSVGGQNAQDAGFQELYGEGQERVHPLSIPRIMANAGACHIAMEFGITGPAYTISTACASSAHAIGEAFWKVRCGMADVALAGGSEAPFSFGFLKAWEALRVVAPDTCRPFSRDRRGLILGEGGAVLVLEPLEAARSRGARVYAEVAGFGMSSDAHHLTHPSEDGPARAMQAALRDGALDPSQVGYINAHGTGTTANDRLETRAIRAVFRTHAERLAVSSTKSMHGHVLGGVGAIEAVCTVLGLYHGVMPPTANFTAPDPECDLDVVPNQPRRASLEAAISNSFAFGGLNAVIAFRAYAG
jgi:nodulation protein E